MGKTFDPQHLDLRAFAQAGAELTGQAPLGVFARLQQEQFGDAAAAQVHWGLQGRMVEDAGRSPLVGLVLQAQVRLNLQCQRCLGPVEASVDAQRDFLFVADEATAEAMDEASEDDVLVLSRDFDALSLVEDELILALPLVPRHAVCEQTLPNAAADADFASASERPHPFAALAALKKTP